MPKSIKLTRRQFSELALGLAAATAPGLLASRAWAAKAYDTGATDTEIKIGQPVPYSGPASFYAAIGKTTLAYFQMLNTEHGGINGRKVTVISLDDGYSPPKVVEVTRHMVEQDGVLAVFGISGSASSTSVQRYLAAKKVPQLFGFSGVHLFGDPKLSPWSVGFMPSYDFEGGTYGKYIRNNVKDPKVAVLYQNDDFGRAMLAGLRKGLGDMAPKIVKEASYEVTDPTVDSQVVSLAGTGANVLMLASIPKPTSQAIRKSAELGWNPLKIIQSGTASITAVLGPAGLDNSVGVTTGKFLKDFGDATWTDDAGMKTYAAFMKKYVGGVNPSDILAVLGYTVAQLMAQVLKQCGDELTRANVLKQACNVRGLHSDMLLPGITLNTEPDNRFPIRQMRMARFDGKHWELFGDLLTE
ncbi:MAG TPA: ABC transporter substrate-binding protein [Hyphomicrobiales bacterium]|nr:ABC transporter substrate-binding protein [Hyphomicrobiales bacterium]